MSAFLICLLTKFRIPGYKKLILDIIFARFYFLNYVSFKWKEEKIHNCTGTLRKLQGIRHSLLRHNTKQFNLRYVTPY